MHKSNAAARLETPEFRDEDFEFFRSLIQSRAGITISDKKAGHMQARLRKRMEALGFRSSADYRALIASLPPEAEEWTWFVNALTTNKTDWFREPDHYDDLARFVKDWLRLGKSRLNVWSAACSTGEEPYTLALVLTELLKGKADFHVHATDIDTEALAVAQNGVYRFESLHTVPPVHREQGFIRGRDEIKDWVRVRDAIKEKVSFQHYNLVHPKSPYRDTFDVIFCRNVMIYFSNDTIAQVAEALYDAGRENSLLMIGHSETLPRAQTRFHYVKPSVYVKGSRFAKGV